MKLKAIREMKNITAVELAKAVGTDKYMISKYENMVCLPTPEVMRRICNFLQCNILDVWEKEEIYIMPSNLRFNERNEFNRVNYYNFGVRLPKSSCNTLKRENLIKLGYTSKKNWLVEQVERLQRDIERFEFYSNKKRA